MTIRERIEAFWAGDRPDKIPYTIYSWERRGVKDDPAWRTMFKAGLGETCGFCTAVDRVEGVEHGHETYDEGGKHVERWTMRTPVGEICRTTVDGWDDQFWLKSAEDYRVMTWIANHTDCIANYKDYMHLENTAEPHMIIHPRAGRTPMQSILVDYVGLEAFGLHLFDLENEMMALYEALLRNFRRRIELIAEGPGKFVWVHENFMSDTMGPERYQKYLVSVYEELFGALHSAGKIVGTHYDGKLATCKEAIAAAPIDLIESLTPPPEGDMTLAECRAAWPDKLFWSNLNVACYNLPTAELKRLVQERVQDAAPDGRRLAFEVSEHLPRNWETSIPVVLEALEEM